MVVRARVFCGWLLAVTFILMSGKSFAENGDFTTESWGFLLLTPLAFALALSACQLMSWPAQLRFFLSDFLEVFSHLTKFREACVGVSYQCLCIVFGPSKAWPDDGGRLLDTS